MSPPPNFLDGQVYGKGGDWSPMLCCMADLKMSLLKIGARLVVVDEIVSRVVCYDP
jgi:hypothetical protein